MTVSLKTTEYDPFITFMKGYAILCVLLAHSLPNPQITGYAFWGGEQVPLFLLIQTFHATKKTPKFKFGKVFKRIILPFLLVQTALLVLSCINGNFATQLKTSVISGGRGPGSYYFWIYLQFALLLPLIYPWLIKLSKTWLLVIFLLISESLEVVSSMLSIPEPIYRLLCFRYIFLIYLGYEWVKQGIVINCKTLVLSLIGILAIILFTYCGLSIEPFFYDTDWHYHRWICYFYVAYVFAYGIYLLYQLVRRSKWISSFFMTLGESSYEIYLVQMAVFTLFKKSYLSLMSINAPTIVWILLTIIISSIGGVLFHRIWAKV